MPTLRPDPDETKASAKSLGRKQRKYGAPPERQTYTTPEGQRINEQLNIRLPPKLKLEFQKKCLDCGLKMNTVIEDFIAKFVLAKAIHYDD